MAGICNLIKVDINEIIKTFCPYCLSATHFNRKMIARLVRFNLIFSAFEKLNGFGYIFRICWKSSNFYIRRTNVNHYLYGNHGLFSSRDVIWWTLYSWNKASFKLHSQIQITSLVFRGGCLRSPLNISETWRVIRRFPWENSVNSNLKLNFFLSKTKLDSSTLPSLQTPYRNIFYIISPQLLTTQLNLKYNVTM